MDETLLFTILVLVGLGVISAVILYIVAQKFKVYEDPRIDETEALLPGANCGGCGYPGCRGLATALVEQDDISAIYCPVGGAATMKACADHLGKAAPVKEPQVAVVRCAGSFCARPKTNEFNGADSCAVIASLYGGETGCTWGCLGKGDCVVVCNFDAIKINQETGLPEVDQDKCTACGACVKACPKMVIELRKKGIKDRRIYVSCINKDKGAVARKACSAACIGCGKCVKTCPHDAITLENNVAYIDFAKCKLCRKCVAECPTGAIVEVNFPPAKPKAETPKAETQVAAKVTPKAEEATVANDTSKTETAVAKETANVETVADKETVKAETPLVARAETAKTETQEKATTVNVAPKAEVSTEAKTPNAEIPKVETSVEVKETPKTETPAAVNEVSEQADSEKTSEQANSEKASGETDSEKSEQTDSHSETEEANSEKVSEKTNSKEV